MTTNDVAATGYTNAARSSAHVGSVINARYRVVALLGSGGMGEVFRAEDLELGRDVALKVLASGRLQSENGLKRLRREARHMAMLQHPNNVRLFEFRELDDGVAYLAMEFVDGRPLSRIGFPIAPARAVRIVTQICSALAEAHARGLVHRDLKPQNVMLTSVDGDEFARVLDYGVAMSLTTPSDITREGHFVGTVLYASPEQADGGPVGPATDIYAVGAIVFEMLTGQRVFSGKTDASLLYQHAHMPPPVLSSVLPGAPAELERLISACLSKDPTRRPASAESLRKALTALLPSLSEEAPALGTIVRRDGDELTSSLTSADEHRAFLPARAASLSATVTSTSTSLGWTDPAVAHRPRLAMLSAAAGVAAIVAFVVAVVVQVDRRVAPAVPVESPVMDSGLAAAVQPGIPSDDRATRIHPHSAWSARFGQRARGIAAGAHVAASAVAFANAAASVSTAAPPRAPTGTPVPVDAAVDVHGTTRLEGELRTLIDLLPEPTSHEASARVRSELDLLGGGN